MRCVWKNIRKSALGVAAVRNGKVRGLAAGKPFQPSLAGMKSVCPEAQSLAGFFNSRTKYRHRPWHVTDDHVEPDIAENFGQTAARAPCGPGAADAHISHLVHGNSALNQFAAQPAFVAQREMGFHARTLRSQSRKRNENCFHAPIEIAAIDVQNAGGFLSSRRLRRILPDRFELGPFNPHVYSLPWAEMNAAYPLGPVQFRRRSDSGIQPSVPGQGVVRDRFAPLWRARPLQCDAANPGLEPGE